MRERNSPIRSIAVLLRRNTIGVWYGVFGLVTLAFQQPLAVFLKDTFIGNLVPGQRLEIAVPLFGGVMLLIGLFTFILRYLNDDLGKSSLETSSIERRDLERLQMEVRYLLDEAKELAQTSKKEHSLTEPERKDIAANLEKVLSDSLRDEALKLFEDKYAKSALGERYDQMVRERFLRSEERLNSETARLGRRGNINLALGFTTTMLALGVLAQITFFAPLPQNLTNYGELAVRYAPRFALAIFIQVFAFFFLRLYKSTLEEIKFFQNEITNIELASIALETSNKAKDAPFMLDLSKRLLEVDRNRTSSAASKVERTKKSQNNDIVDLIGIAKDILGKIKT